ncbi:ABC transporter ATP-binding protein [Cellulomonas sp. C5510]|uniref:ABC transporter ATP-binding protein n=1 Tax=Cellulomonas sp. C5510 TaxID=2871170 RepID=UPI001C947651|nr:ABC transporter ATP-binding protein [Cellulomonas sp. C5510]QZN87016.1 ABC transporter ATP-binding protein [Cellulomonas sp. C5510]
MIEAVGVHHAWGRDPVLRGVDLTVAPGEVVALVGPNGSGKTTLLRTLYRAVTPDAGTVRVGGDDLRRLRRAEIARRLAVVVQEDPGDLPQTAAQTVLLGRHPARTPRTPRTAGAGRGGHDDHAAALAALHRVGAAHLARRPVTELSGGERQRVLIARALAQGAPRLLLDEPTNHLDVHYQHEVLHLVRDLGLTTVVVLHDLNLAARYADRLVLLDAGRVVAQGAPADVLSSDALTAVLRVDAAPVRAGDGRPQLLFRRAGA